MSQVAMMQGRLYPERPDAYQIFPSARWEDELAVAAELGYDGLELLLDRERKCIELASTGLMDIYRGRFPSACLDILAHVGPVGGGAFGEALGGCLEICRRLEVETIVIPLVESNAAKDATELSRMLGVIVPMLGDLKCRGAIESDLPLADLVQVLVRFELGLCYDTGNARALGRLPECELAECQEILRHLHVKDRVVGGVNVPLGTGDVDFLAVGEALGAIRYEGTVGLETAYGTNALESARSNRIHVGETFGF